MNEQAQRKWGYTVRRWVGFHHYHVTLFPDCELREILGYKWDIDLTGHSKFNTPSEADKFVVKVRRALARRGIKLSLLEKDIAR